MNGPVSSGDLHPIKRVWHILVRIYNTYILTVQNKKGSEDRINWGMHKELIDSLF